MNYDIASITHIGKVRQINQDRVLARTGRRNGHNAALLVVADGMGGLAYGERASALTVEALDRWWESTPLTNKLEEIAASLDAAIYEIHRQIFYLSEELQQQTGSTLSVLLLLDTAYIIKQIGDSRVYCSDGRSVQQLTEDQTWCNQMIRNGTMTPDEAGRHRLRHALVNALGVSSELEIATLYGTLRRHTSYLLCSDGFYSQVSMKRMVMELKKGQSSVALQRLLEEILSGPAEDNASAVLCRVS